MQDIYTFKICSFSFAWFTVLTDFRCNAHTVVDTVINIGGISKCVFLTIINLHLNLKYFCWWI